MSRLVVVLALYGGLSLQFQWRTPPLEASDEARHFGYVVHVARTGALPEASLGRPGLARQEATQAPLYYELAAALIASDDVADAEAFFTPRPGSPLGRADLPGPRDMFVRPSASLESPTRGAVRRLRLFSMLIGAAVVALTFRLARRMDASADAATLAAMLVGLNPMFLFVSSAVSNDALAAALVTAVASRCSGRDFDATRPLQACACGLLAGLAALAKASGAIAFPYLLYRLYAARSDRGKLLLSGLAAAGAFGLTCGPFYARNLILYGDPLATAVHAALAGNRRGQWAPFALVSEWDGFVKSLWGVFGAFNIVFPDLVYWAFFALTAVLVAAALASLRGGDPRRLGLACLVALNLLAAAAWTSRLLGSQGRLLFPCWPALCVLSALGLARFPRALPWLGVAGLVLLAGSASFAALVLIPRAYVAP